MIDKYCRTKAKGNESKTFREHSKELLEQQKQAIEQIQRELDEFKAPKETNATRKVLKDTMINTLQAKWDQERDSMVKAADQLEKMLACSSQKEAVKLWAQYEKVEDDLNAQIQIQTPKSSKKSKLKEPLVQKTQERIPIRYERQSDKKTQCCIHMIFASILLLVIIATTTIMLVESNHHQSKITVDSGLNDATKISANKQGALGKQIHGVKSNHHHDVKKDTKNDGHKKNQKDQKKDDKKVDKTDAQKVKKHQKPEAKPKAPTQKITKDEQRPKKIVKKPDAKLEQKIKRNAEHVERRPKVIKAAKKPHNVEHKVKEPQPKVEIKKEHHKVQPKVDFVVP